MRDLGGSPSAVHPPPPVIFLRCFCSKGEFKAAVIAVQLCLCQPQLLSLTTEGNLMQQLPGALLHSSLPRKAGEGFCRSSLSFLFFT